jgi:hypothetical protein
MSAPMSRVHVKETFAQVRGHVGIFNMDQHGPTWLGSPKVMSESHHPLGVAPTWAADMGTEGS